MEHNDKIRILQVVPNMQAGGLETLIMNLYRNIDKSKVQFDFLVHYKERKFYDDEIEKLGGKIYRCTLRNDNNIFKYKTFLNKFFQSHPEYKIIHCHMCSIGSMLFKIAKKYGKKVLIAHSHNSQTEQTLKGKIKHLLMKNIAKYSTCNFACSNTAGLHLFKNANYTIIENAIDIEKYKFDIVARKQLRKDLLINDDCFVLGNVGRLNIQKNHIFLLKSFQNFNKNHPNSKLLIVGSGELENEITQFVEENNLQNLVIILKDRKDVNKLYSAMDCFVLPSLFEGLPLVAIEAQASGLSCYLSDKITQEVDITGTIKFVSIENPTSFSEAISTNTNTQERSLAYLPLLNTNYNIKTQAKRIQNMYINMYKEANETKD